MANNTIAANSPRADTRFSGGAILKGGVLAGIIAGVMMGMVAMIRGALEGSGFWLPMKLISAVFYGIDALTQSAGPILVGMMIHFMTSAIFGIGFAALIKRSTSKGSAMLGGLFYGVGVWAIMTYIGLPIFNELMRERVYGVTPGWWFLYHLVFGAVLMITPALCRKFERVRAAEEEQPSVRRMA